MTTTYSHSTVKKQAKRQAARDASKSTHTPTTAGGAGIEKPQTACLFVKTFDPVSGTCLRIRIDKANQLSRVWSALGPRGVQVHKKSAGSGEAGAGEVQGVRGAASVMGNDGREAYTAEEESITTTPQQAATPVETQPQQQQQQPTAGGKKKKNKKR